MNPFHSINQEFTRMVVEDWSASHKGARTPEKSRARRVVGGGIRALAARLIAQLQQQYKAAMMWRAKPSRG